MAPFDPTNKEYQVSPDYPPDKESKWPYPKENDGWMHAHNSLRSEMSQMREALESTMNRANSGEKTGITQWEANCIKSAWGSHLTHIHCHHKNEDDKMVPYLLTRCKYPEKSAAEHKELVAMMERIDAMVKNVKKGDDITEIHAALSEYEKDMKEHLLEEEEQGLPLCRAYFTPEEIGPIVGEILAHSPDVELGSFIKCMGVKRFRKEFMPQEHIPWFVWYVAFKSKVKQFEKQFEVPIAHLKSGEAPKKGKLLVA